MCGIAGIWQPDLTAGNADLIATQARRMAETLAHRGPDDSGLWEDRDMGVALAHRRLAILDLSPEGHQPMRSADGRYVLVYNGEIYNFRALRDELIRLGATFRGDSDTEVLLAGISHWGLDRMLTRINGMFAFALWDRRSRHLILVRDRLGKKPLYFGWVGKAFVFASELKALRALHEFSGELDHEAVALYLRFGYVPTPWCIFRDIHKLRQGGLLRLDWRQVIARCDAAQRVRGYWSHAEAAHAGIKKPFDADDESASDTLDAMLRDATAQRMVAHVPVGAFLSGGIDSSLIVSLMQAQSDVPVKTFSLGFEGYDNNETPHAKAIADYLGTEHTEMHVSGQEVIDNIPRIPDIVDEPLADFAQVPNYLIAALARDTVKVVLSGDGGDELFGGYRRLINTAAHWRSIRRMPSGARRLIARLLFPWLRYESEQTKWIKIHSRLAARNVDELYFYKLTQWLAPTRLLIDGYEPETGLTDYAKWPDIVDPLHRVLLLDQTYHLPDVILTKVDRTSMATGLEVRSPLLDYRVFEWAWRLPSHIKIRNDQGKWILRNLLARYLPRELFERPKQGFGAPISQWLAGPLRDWADDLLACGRLRNQGLLNPEPIARLWAAQRAGMGHGPKNIWNLLMLQAWLDRHTAN